MARGTAGGRLPRGLLLRVWVLPLLSVALLACSMGAYAYAFPSLLPLVRDAQAESPGDPASAGAAPAEGAGGQAASADAASAQGEGDAAAGEGQGDEPVSFGAATLSSVTLPDLSGVVEGADAAEGAQGDAGPGGDEAPAQPSGGGNADAPDADGGSDVPAEEPAPSGPSESEEQAFRSFLVDKASAVPDYTSRMSACASAFSADAATADLSTRNAHRSDCAALREELFYDYIALRDYVRSNDSRYCDEQERLIGAYRCLTSYVDCYCSAWDLNVGYEDPAAHVDEFMGPLQGVDGYVSEFHGYYDGLVI